MKKILFCLALILSLQGCASSTFATAKSNANSVTNGMSIMQATKILGMTMTRMTGNRALWQHGRATGYDGTTNGAIEFKVDSEGKIFGIPPGGVFSDEAKRLHNQEVVAAAEKKKADREAEIAAGLERERKKQLRAEADEKELVQLMALETQAAEKRTVVCEDKAMCTKVFALAQIYTAQKADQKIQVATDTIIETYNPTEPGKLGAAITKTPQKGTKETVTVVPSCKPGETSAGEKLCMMRRTDFYLGFRPFIEASLKK